VEQLCLAAVSSSASRNQEFLAPAIKFIIDQKFTKMQLKKWRSLWFRRNENRIAANGLALGAACGERV
jgi:hypothetical protein